MKRIELKDKIYTYIKSLKEGAIKDIYWFHSDFAPDREQNLPVPSGLRIELNSGYNIYITGGSSSGMDFMQILIYSPEGVYIEDDEFEC